MTTKNKTYYTTYSEAVNWMHNNYIMCNNITEIDDSIYNHFRFNMEDDDGNFVEIFQWFISDCSEYEVEFLEKHFGLLFTYSELLDKYILCVDHCGTSWNYVQCQLLTYSKTNWDNYECPHAKSYKELTNQEF